jgi:hypothetical protein
MEVLAAADKLQLTDLRGHCLAYLGENICADNVCTVVNASRHFGLAKLEKQSLDFLLTNAGSALESSGMKHLPKETLLSVVEGDDLDVGEEVIFTALMGWCEANKSDGQSVKDEFAAFLPSVRFAAMSHVFLHQTVTPSGLVPPEIVMQALIAQLEESGLVKPEDLMQALLAQLNGLKCKGAGDLMQALLAQLNGLKCKGAGAKRALDGAEESRAVKQTIGGALEDYRLQQVLLESLAERTDRSLAGARKGMH